MNKFKDSLKLGREFNASEFAMNYTTLDDYFRSPFVPDNQKVLIALLVIKKRFKTLDVSNSFVATFLNKKGIYTPIYERVTKEDKNGEIIDVEQIKEYRIIYSSYKCVAGKQSLVPLYTKTAVSDAIKKWEHEGVLKCNYEYEYNKAQNKLYKYIARRTITFNYDALKPILTCFELDSNFYQSLPKRNRKRKLIRQRPFSILDDLKDLLSDMTDELKKKYQTAKGIFLNWCWNVSRKYMRSTLKQKPTASETTTERRDKINNRLLKSLLEPIEYIDYKTENKEQGNEQIKAVFKMMVGNN